MNACDSSVPPFNYLAWETRNILKKNNYFNKLLTTVPLENIMKNNEVTTTESRSATDGMHWQQRRTAYADHHSPPDVSAQLSALHHDPTAHHINNCELN